MGSILIVDDDDDILVAGRLLLKRHFSKVVTSNRPEHIPELFQENSFDAVLLDMNFGPGESSGQEGFYWLNQIMTIDPDAVVIVITAHGSVNIAVDAMKVGATDFISKPWQNEKVVATLSAAVKLRRTRNEASSLKLVNRTLVESGGTGHKQPFLGNSSAIQNVKSIIERTAPTDANVLILGENGTGKELVARDLHRYSSRRDQIFLSVDLGSVSESLFDSELFGHKKGSFTDAKEDRTGRFQAVNGGTLFLDEVGNLPLHLQSKLLTVLEQRQVTPVGSNKPIAIDVRIIAATNIPKEKLQDENHFRQDLLFRLNTVEINVPPLRERSEDIEEIALYYSTLYCKKYNKALKKFSGDAMQYLKHYSWPGNIRALRHAIERAVILCAEDTFQATDFSLGDEVPNVTPSSSSPLQNADVPDISAVDNDVSVMGSDDLNLERMEKALIEKSLKKHRYNISHAAKDLGLTRAALYRRMEKYAL